jgi:16S rRNA U516 pseudouridylate synthase RsuA-like enzyme
MCSHLGFHVLQIRRIREGEIRLGDLKSGAWRHFTDKELEYIDKLKRERDGSIE